jgi:uncharacterized protein involved in exopolysaccharide biosynthesis
MSTPTTPPQPTEAQVYAAYQSLLDILTAECKAASGAATLPLNDAAQVVSDLMSDQNKIDLEANTAAFTALTPGMKTANAAIKDLKAQIASIAAGINNVAKIEGAINQVLQLTGKFL